MRRIINILLLTMTCLVLSTGCSKESVVEENLVKYGTEYADFEYPSDDIAWELLRVTQEEFQLYDIDLRPQSVELEPIEISEFEEKLEFSAICCQPYGELLIEDGRYQSGSLWIRAGWSPETNELKNIYIEFNDDYIDWDSLAFSIFHNSDIEGLGEIYDELYEAEPIEINGYEMRIVDNVVALSFTEGICNIEFLPHSVYVENNKLFYSTGKEVNIDNDKARNIIW